MSNQFNREIILDTETTGLSPEKGDRIVEIGCIELVNYNLTGNEFHKYLNPEREMSEGAFRVSGISDEFLKDKPHFKEIANDLINFIGNSKIVAHNAPFDIGFLNNELKISNKKQIEFDSVIDTLALARKKFPGAQASLDALCKRFEIDNSKRVKHGALLDAYLLTEVYIELIGGKQTTLILTEDKKEKISISNKKKISIDRKYYITEEEKLAHQDMLNLIQKPIWNKR
ncbi:DNA polymerase III subunit epsilon [Alphaproteobacteria bacterium]|nr:DNA polymerase III subunit epsilon [Alphaproteobacteria bacterium]